MATHEHHIHIELEDLALLAPDEQLFVTGAELGVLAIDLLAFSNRDWDRPWQAMMTSGPGGMGLLFYRDGDTVTNADDWVAIGDGDDADGMYRRKCSRLTAEHGTTATWWGSPF